MLQGSLLRKVTSRRAKERRFRLQEDGVTVVSERRFGRAPSKQSCECRRWAPRGWGHWCGPPVWPVGLILTLAITVTLTVTVTLTP